MKRISILMLILVTCFVSAAWPQAGGHSKRTIITFDAPGAGTGSGQGTLPYFINSAGVIAGQYIDANNAYHGFVRSRDGAITTFDVLGAGTGAGQGTLPWSINPAGVITGYYTDDTGLSHGFVRYPDSAITTFDVPGAGRPVKCEPPLICSNGTQGASINPEGAISGQYADNSGVFHGFLRSPDGTLTTFDAPGAGTSLGQGTLVTFGDGINPEGAIATAPIKANYALHGAIRLPDGRFVTYDAPGAGTGQLQGTDTAGITPRGTVAAIDFSSLNVAHGYVRAFDGSFTLFDVPGAGTGSGQGTEPFNINAAGDITGPYIDASGVSHGFLRTKDGVITTFDAPGAGTGSGQGTEPFCNNRANAITGSYIDASGVFHGFLRRSKCDRHDDGHGDENSCNFDSPQ
jgi:hypothetical protein